jgi:hypothetical protein
MFDVQDEADRINHLITRNAYVPIQAVEISWTRHVFPSQQDSELKIIIPVPLVYQNVRFEKFKCIELEQSRVQLFQPLCIPALRFASSSVWKNPLNAEKVEGNTKMSLLTPKIATPKSCGRKRTEERSNLVFQRFKHDSITGTTHRIRMWSNIGKMHFYDCSCGKRKPTQDIQKIRNHIARVHKNQD